MNSSVGKFKTREQRDKCSPEAFKKGEIVGSLLEPLRKRDGQFRTWCVERCCAWQQTAPGADW